MATLKEIRKELKEKGLRKEDIEAAMALSLRLATLDELVFPENPAAIHFANIKTLSFEGAVAYISSKDGKKGFYEIYVPEIKNFLEEERKKYLLFIVRKPRRKTRLQRPTWEELFVCMAAHEVRHRVQDEYPIKMFSPESAYLVSEEFLRWIIEFYELEFEERKKIYLQENKSEEFIRDRLSQKEFDAKVIAELVANKIHRKNAYSLREEIAEIIKMSAP